MQISSRSPFLNDHRKPWPVLNIWAATYSFDVLVGRPETDFSHISSREKKRRAKFISEGVSAEQTQKIMDWLLPHLDLSFIKD